MTQKFRVLGAGIWGLAFSDYLLNLGHEVLVFCRDTTLSNKKIEDLKLLNLSSNNVQPLNSLKSLDSNDAINIIAVNSKGFDDLLTNYYDYFKSSDKLVSLTKGIDHDNGYLFHESVNNIFPNIEYGLISGPSFAKDLIDRKKIIVSFASEYKQLTEIMTKSTKSSYFEMVPTFHIYHIQIAGILKNIAAIICGMADAIFGKGIHTNTIIKKACDETWEMSYDQLDGYEFDDDDDEKNWINDLNKNREAIITSPGYIGDMILTCKQDQSRNYQFGHLISKSDISIKQAKDKIGTVEGYDCCLSLVEKSSRKQGELTNLLYMIINSKNNDRINLLKSFLQS